MLQNVLKAINYLPYNTSKSQENRTVETERMENMSHLLKA